MLLRPGKAELLNLKIDEQMTLMRDCIPQIAMNFHLINKYKSMTFESSETKNIEIDKTYERAALCSNESFLHQFQDEKEASSRAEALTDLAYMVLSPDGIITESAIDQARLGRVHKLPIRSQLHRMIMMMANEEIFHEKGECEQQ